VSKRAKQKEPASGDAARKPESIARKAYSSIAAIVAGMVARKAVEKAWVKATGKKPPKDPESPAVHWIEAVGWSVASGTTVAVARLLATRKAAGAWQRVSADGKQVSAEPPTRAERRPGAS